MTDNLEGIDLHRMRPEAFRGLDRATVERLSREVAARDLPWIDAMRAMHLAALNERHGVEPPEREKLSGYHNVVIWYEARDREARYAEALKRAGITPHERTTVDRVVEHPFGGPAFHMVVWLLVVLVIGGIVWALGMGSSQPDDGHPHVCYDNRGAYEC